MRLALYCDFVTEETRPLQLILRIDDDSEGFNWTRILYLPLSGPFERFEPEEFEDQIGVSVLLEDLLVPQEHVTAPEGMRNIAAIPLAPNKLGIDLPQIADRHPGAEIALLVIQVADAEEALGYGWRTWLQP